MRITHDSASKLAASLLILFVVDGCYSTPESFARRASKLDCVRMRECQGEVFEQQFHGEMDECRDAFEDVANEAIDSLEAMGCDYDADKGRDCIHAAYRNRKDCSDGADEEIGSECEGVFVCPGALVDEDSAPSVVDSLQVTVPTEGEP